MSKCHPPLPNVWLVSDARNDAMLEAALKRLPRGSGLIFRHYHLSPQDRRARFDDLRKAARSRSHLVILAGTSQEAVQWGADGIYCAPAPRPARDKLPANGRKAGASGIRVVRYGGTRSQLARGRRIVLLTAHSLRDIRHATRADAIVLSPVFATRSHPGARALGGVRFRLLAKHAQVPVIALGGMTAKRAAMLKPAAWAAIDGLSPAAKRGISKDS